MTASRLMVQVRKNPDFIQATRLLDELGLDWTLEAPRGRGHPRLRIGSILFSVASSPRGHSRALNTRTALRRRLIEAGIIEGAA